MGFFDRIKERKLFQWGIAYLAGAWLALEAVDLLIERLGWPPAVFPIALTLLAIGLLGALVLAWYHGEKGHQRVTGMEIAMLTGILVIAAVAVTFVGGRATPGDPAPQAGTDTEIGDRRSIAVLPFVSLSTDQENAYFASGIHDELLTQLSKLGGLKVISRTSVQQYAGTTKTIRQIARELGVGVILEGSVQRAGNKVRVQAQLIDAATDEHLWAERYDRDLTDIFAIQSDLAQQIAGALQANLSAGEQAAIARPPTTSAEAYDLYLQAREYHRRDSSDEDNPWRTAERLYQRAVGVDPEFALAHAWLSQLYGRLYWWGVEPGAETVQKQKAAADRALALQPDLTEAHVAMGYYYYWGRRDYERALDQLNAALRSAPGNGDVQTAIGYVYRRKGDLTQAAARLASALALNPRDAALTRELAETYFVMRRHAEARRLFDRAIALEPDHYGGHSRKAKLLVAWHGEVDSLRSVVQRFPEGRGESEHVAYDRFLVARLAGDRAGALRAAEAAPAEITLQYEYVPKGLLLGWARAASGDAAGARTAFESARAAAAAEIRKYPDSFRYRIAHAHALAGLGRTREAREEAERVLELMPPERDAYLAPQIAYDRAAILAQIGDRAAAIAELQQVTVENGRRSSTALRLDPIWDPLRKDPRFAELSRARY